MHGFLPARGADDLIAELAEQQHGVVAHRQLKWMGLGRGVIEHRLACGRLHRIHRGVYAVGHRILTPDGWRIATVLAAGDDAVLAHESAAELWRIRGMARRRHVVIVPRRVRLPSIDAREGCLPDDEIRVVRGIPVTSVPRTILDLAATRSEQEVARLINEADVKQLWDALSLSHLLERYPRRHGSKTLRRALAERPIGVPKNVFEDAFLAFLERHGLPRPEVNVWLTVGRHMYEVDCLWRRERLIVALDGRAAHDTAKAFEGDRARDRRLRVARWNPIRVTWRQLQREQRELAHDLQALLS